MPGGASSASRPSFHTPAGLGPPAGAWDWPRLVPSILPSEGHPLLCPGSGLELWGEALWARQTAAGQPKPRGLALGRSSGSLGQLSLIFPHLRVPTPLPSPPNAPAPLPAATEAAPSSAGDMADTPRDAALKQPPAPRNEKAPVDFGYVGIDSILEQMRRKAMKQGFEFNIMVVGEFPRSHQAGEPPRATQGSPPAPPRPATQALVKRGDRPGPQDTSMRTLLLR